MKAIPVPDVDHETAAEMQDLLRSANDLDHVLRVMRARGMNKIASMKLLRDYAGMSLLEAKRVVHLSPVWEDRKLDDDRLHKSASVAMESGALHLGRPALTDGQRKRPA